MAVLVVVAALLIRLLGGGREAGVKITFRGYQDYWETKSSPPDAGRPEMLHWPREVRFMVKNQMPGLIGIWPGARLESKPSAGIGNVVPGCQGVMAAQATMEMTFALTGAGRGQWRILIPISDLRLLLQVEKWIGDGAISDWIKQHQKNSPQWIASDWVNELPQRSSLPPVEAERDGNDQPVRIKAPR